MSGRLPPEPDPGGTGELPAPAAGGPPGERLLRRSASDKVLAGVCGGLGRYRGVEPLLLRIAAVVLALANGVGLIAYVVAWIAIPEERAGSRSRRSGHRSRRRAGWCSAAPWSCSA